MKNKKLIKFILQTAVILFLIFTFVNGVLLRLT